MDCSNVEDSTRLTEIFQTPFAFNDFERLIIDPLTPVSTLYDLPAGVFGPVSFKEIDVMNTLIETVEEEAIVNSHNTLVRLNMRGNKIREFPFETLDLYVWLKELNLANNQLLGVMPDIVTEALTTLDLSGNTGFILTETVFTGSPHLEVLRLNNMALGDTTPPNVFLDLSNLKTLYLQNNDIPGTLIEDFINTLSQPLLAVYLDGNSLSQIHPLSVTGLSDSGIISFTNNQIQYLTQGNWGELVSRLTRYDAIDMRHNPLVCGCDVYWLLLDSSAMRVFNSLTTCSGGNLMTDLPKPWFDDHCATL
ncbi:oplophorus-luciferin 2-monooxygenase non-catalytic subunit-like isoform X2 [Eriocheir sinensis]|uniref:oplophorus-luciferin 2-monooxygenase non-catalytic subunit-like isoform X1 n=1 Tax=Eriocheir sinensis TaxID=95602 RepID=UPI0021CAD684|nr:oplophorus-luciferin 2-monooxygenase non-catalytic subunit-like isoform X1 [Eriocheir sinensis]XP_050705662.1 oplophorus-luciferin 2-monooxygenase non-catalytic subunit-like isoform X2 [Eriocheir sinensis]